VTPDPLDPDRIRDRAEALSRSLAERFPSVALCGGSRSGVPPGS
jgi:hypothetical protein